MLYLKPIDMSNEVAGIGSLMWSRDIGKLLDADHGSYLNVYLY